MRILAVIPARGGSKRVPGKNMRKLGNKPLINWTIDSAFNTPELSAIMVSTDDPQIAEIAQSAGATVPWLRPIKLATDESKSVDVAIHALDWYETENGKVDGILLLQPTSPFRSQASIQKGIELFIKHNYQTVIGVTPTHAHPMWTFKQKGNYLVPYIDGLGFKTRSQDLPLAYLVSGSFYLISPKELRIQNSFVTPKIIPLLIESPQEALDIDTEWDFKLAEFIAASYYEH